MNQFKLLNFEDRHIGPKQSEINQMLEHLAYENIEQLLADTIPQTIRHLEKLDLPAELSEAQALIEIKRLAKKNKSAKNFRGY
jgi:glycine dehydrogenase